MELIKIENIGGELRVDSRIIAEELGNEHKAVIQMIRKHIARLEIYGRVPFRMLPFETAGGNQRITIAFLNERQSTFLVTLSKNSEKAVDLKQKLVDSYYEHKNKSAFAIPQTYAEALQLAADQTKKLEEAKPKIDFYDKLESSENSISVAEFANLLCKNGFQIGQNRLFKFFYEYGYMLKSDRPAQVAMNLELFEIKLSFFKDHENRKILVTGKGQIYFTKKLVKLGGSFGI